MPNPFDSIPSFITNTIDSQIRATAQQSVEQFVGDALNTGASWVSNKIGDIANDISEATGFGKLLRSANLPTGQVTPRTTAEFSASPEDKDWRVKLSVPSMFSGSPLLNPLVQTGGFVFPFTPTIVISHSAHYNALQPVHTNYPYNVYTNSQTDEMVITGEFYSETAEDAKYWIGAVHYLRSCTKMFYGEGEYSGSPPPIVKLNGYGDYVFNQVPVVITNFTVDLPADVDYISVPLEGTSVGGTGGTSHSWVPVQSQISVTVRPTYSRQRTATFNLTDFVNGSYVANGSGFI